jgi:hypothetical protein
MEYSSAAKKKESILLAGEWMELEIVIFSETSYSQNDEGHMIFLIWGPKRKCKRKRGAMETRRG